MTSLVIDERIDAAGDHHVTRLLLLGDALFLQEDDDERIPLPARAIAVTMQRYGRELDDGIEPQEELALPGHGTVARLRFRAVVDADVRDYVVWTEPGKPAVAAIARDIAAALRFLADNPVSPR